MEMPKNAKREFLLHPNRAPAETQQSGFGGKRTSDRESESCRLRRDEGLVIRSDDGDGDGKQSVRPTLSDGWRKFCGALPHTR